MRPRDSDQHLVAVWIPSCPQTQPEKTLKTSLGSWSGMKHLCSGTGVSIQRPVTHLLLHTIWFGGVFFQAGYVRSRFSLSGSSWWRMSNPETLSWFRGKLWSKRTLPNFLGQALLFRKHYKCLFYYYCFVNIRPFSLMSWCNRVPVPLLKRYFAKHGLAFLLSYSVQRL